MLFLLFLPENQALYWSQDLKGLAELCQFTSAELTLQCSETEKWLILYKYFGRSNCEEWSLNHSRHSGDSKAQETNYDPAYKCRFCVQELQLTAWFPLPFPIQVFQYCYICHILHPGTKRTGEEAGVKVRDWEIQLGGKKMKREKNNKCS